MIYNVIYVMHLLMLYRNTYIFASFFLNIFIQVIFPNIIETKLYKFQNEIILLTKSVMPKRLTKMLTGVMHKRIH